MDTRSTRSAVLVALAIVGLAVAARATYLAVGRAGAPWRDGAVVEGVGPDWTVDDLVLGHDLIAIGTVTAYLGTFQSPTHEQLSTELPPDVPTQAWEQFSEAYGRFEVAVQEVLLDREGAFAASGKPLWIDTPWGPPYPEESKGLDGYVRVGDRYLFVLSRVRDDDGYVMWDQMRDRIVIDGPRPVDSSGREVPSARGLDTTAFLQAVREAIGRRYGRAAAAYPPPGSTATATPGTGADGRLPVPTSVMTVTTTLADSPYSSLLIPIQAALDSEDVDALGDMFEETRISTLQPMVILNTWTDEMFIVPDDLPGVLSALFDTSSQLKIQGYLEEYQRDGNIYLFISGWGGPVSLPRSEPIWDPAHPTPTATPVGTPDTTATEYIPWGDEIPAGTYVWRVEDVGGEVVIHSWGVYDFSDSVELLYWDLNSKAADPFSGVGPVPFTVLVDPAGP